MEKPQVEEVYSSMYVSPESVVDTYEYLPTTTSSGGGGGGGGSYYSSPSSSYDYPEEEEEEEEPGYTDTMPSYDTQSIMDELAVPAEEVGFIDRIMSSMSANPIMWALAAAVAGYGAYRYWESKSKSMEEESVGSMEEEAG